jgi:hypothetical protein
VEFRRQVHWKAFEVGPVPFASKEISRSAPRRQKTAYGMPHIEVLNRPVGSLVTADVD